MNRRTKIGASIAAGATAVLAATAIAVASPSTSSQADDATPNPTPSASADKAHTPETPLTGSDAEKATAAAKTAVPGGTILRVETDSDGGGAYEAHVRKSDGTEVVVLMDDTFNVTSVEEFAGRAGRGGPGRDPSQAGPGETLLTGDDAAKATAAAEKAVEGGTILRVETDADGGATYEAHVRKSDGTEVVVLMDGSFQVTGVEEFAGRGGRGRGDRDGDGTSDTDTDSDDATASPTSTTSA